MWHSGPGHAICNLVVDTELAVTLGTSPDCAIIEGLIQVLNTHAADADVLEEALMACSALAAVEDNQARLSEVDIYNPMCKAMTRHLKVR